MGWFYLILGALIEIGWAFGLKYSEGFTHPLLSFFTLLLIALSFFFFSLALKTIPMGAAYAAFTGTGTLGTVCVGTFFLNEEVDVYKAIFVLLLIIGIVGLKLTSENEEKTEMSN